MLRAVIVVPSLEHGPRRDPSRPRLAPRNAWAVPTQQYVVPGGKPLNVARFLGAMGVPCRLVVLADAALAAETRRSSRRACRPSCS